MILLEKKARLKWNNANKKRYIKLGYIFTKTGEEFFVEIEHLNPTTRAIIYVLCDFCKIRVEEKIYKDYIHSKDRSISPHDCCKNCREIKIQEGTSIKYGVNSINQLDSVKQKKIETCLRNYGVENPLQSKEIFEKCKMNNIEKYGVENVFQSAEIKEKLVQTNREKYGVDYYTQTEEYKEKTKNTSLEKYGTENPAQSEIVKNKIRQTNISRYGVPVATQNKEIIEKSRKTLYENGSAPTSKQQILIHNYIGGEINFPIGNCSLDIAILDKKINIEYDGGGHDLSVKLGRFTDSEFIQSERRRDYFLIHKGWRIIRIVSRKDLLPPMEELCQLVNECIEYLESGRHFIKIDIDNKIISCSQYVKDIEFSYLKQLPR